MIIARSPLRISLGGGGTDLQSYYSVNGGFLIAGAIDRYVYVNIMRPFTPGIYLKYSDLENVEKPNDVKHPIIRETLKLFGDSAKQIEITTLADIPAGTGLGSSGSFTTALLKALYAFKRNSIEKKDLAELACKIEIELLHEPIGKQDQYIASFGGLTAMTFNKSGEVLLQPLQVSTDTIHDLEDNLLLFFTGYSRSAGSILKDQKQKSEVRDSEMFKNLDFVKELGIQSKNALESGNMDEFGRLMHLHWEHKRRRSEGMSNPNIDVWYNTAIENGAIGGKLVGAGGGGFLMFLARDRKLLRETMVKAGLEEVRFHFDFEGTKLLLNS